MQKMGHFYGSEQPRQDTFFDEVKGIFPKYIPEQRQGAKTDAPIKVSINGRDYTLANWEFKNEMKGISSESNVQNIGYFIHLQSRSGVLQCC